MNSCSITRAITLDFRDRLTVEFNHRQRPRRHLVRKTARLRAVTPHVYAFERVRNPLLLQLHPNLLRIRAPRRANRDTVSASAFPPRRTFRASARASARSASVGSRLASAVASSSRHVIVAPSFATNVVVVAPIVARFPSSPFAPRVARRHALRARVHASRASHAIVDARALDIRAPIGVSH